MRTVRRGAGVLAIVLAALVASLPSAAGAASLTGAITEFSVPWPAHRIPGIASGPDGVVWITINPTPGLGRVAPSGSVTTYQLGPESAIGMGRGIHDLVAGPDGNIWFTQMVANSIGRLRLEGGRVAMRDGQPIADYFPLPTGSPGRGTSSRPWGITAGPDGNVWFVEQGAGKVARITPAGLITEFPIPTPDSGPDSIAPGPDGALWFTEASANKIGRITVTGVLSEFAIPTPDSYPTGITAGPDGNVWFIEADANKVGRISQEGAITEFPIPTAGRAFVLPVGLKLGGQITTGPDGNLWFTQITANRIGRITPNGVITEFPVPSPNALPAGITAGPDGNVWFSEFNGPPASVPGVGRVLVAHGGRPLAATLSGAAEVPGPGDPDGTGAARVTVNPGQGEVCYQITVRDIATRTAAHIHQARTGRSGPVVVTLDPPVTGSTSNCTTVSRQLARAILKNPSGFYLNVHTGEFPAGAVRGQLHAARGNAGVD